MAQAITLPTLNAAQNFVVTEVARDSSGLPTGSGVGYSAFADQTATTTATAAGAGDMRVPCRTFKALVYFKTVTVGSAESYITLEVADATNFGTARRILDIKPLGQVIATAERTFFLFGLAPLAAGQQYARIAVTFGSGASGTFDAIIEAA